MKKEIVGFEFDPEDPKTDYKFKVLVEDVIGLTMAPDGVCFANLKGFRQARIRFQDYQYLKENPRNVE